MSLHFSFDFSFRKKEAVRFFFLIYMVYVPIIYGVCFYPYWVIIPISPNEARLESSTTATDFSRMKRAC